jgi:hypothetical protein
MVRMAPSLLGLVLLAAWLGAATLVAAAVAPAAFAVLPSRTLAGALVGRVLPVIFWSGIVVGVTSLLAARAAGAGITAVAGSLILVAGCAIAQLVISPRIERMRDAIGGPVDALALADPRRVDFGRLHGLSVLAMGVAGVGALLALVMLVRLASMRNPT